LGWSKELHPSFLPTSEIEMKMKMHRQHEQNLWILIAGIGFFVGLGIVGTLESVQPVLKGQQVRTCVVSMGATTDSEINQALEDCAEQYDYLINEEDRP
jgi:hypothetical protein